MTTPNETNEETPETIVRDYAVNAATLYMAGISLPDLFAGLEHQAYYDADETARLRESTGGEPVFVYTFPQKRVHIRHIKADRFSTPLGVVSAAE